METRKFINYLQFLNFQKSLKISLFFNSVFLLLQVILLELLNLIFVDPKGLVVDLSLDLVLGPCKDVLCSLRVVEFVLDVVILKLIVFYWMVRDETLVFSSLIAF